MVNINENTGIKIKAVWKQVLQLDEIDDQDNFFELGGDSLLAIRMIAMLNGELQYAVSIRDLFIYPTILSLSAFLTEHQYYQTDILLKAGEEQADYPLSYNQQQLWFIDQLYGSRQYHIPIAYQLAGKLKLQELEQSFLTVIQRHEILRTVLRHKDDVIIQQVLTVRDFKLNIITCQPGETKQEILERLIDTPFVLAEELMLKAHLINFGNDKYILLIVLHHIAADGWSIGLLLAELMDLYTAYTGKSHVQLLPLPLRYTDYVNWQHKRNQDGSMDGKIAYWKERLTACETLALPIDYPRPAILGHYGASCTFRLSKDSVEQLKAYSNEQGVTLFTIMLGVFKVLLYRYSNQEDICVGVPVAGRTEKQLEGLIGFFVNTIVLRSNVAGSLSFFELLQQLKETIIAGFENQEVPFQKVVELVTKERNLSSSPLFQVFFSYNNTAGPDQFDLTDLVVQPEELAIGTSQFELSLVMTETIEGLLCNFQYNTQLFSAGTIHQMQEHYEQLLLAVVQQPKEQVRFLPMLNEKESLNLLKGGRSGGLTSPADKTLVSLVNVAAAEYRTRDAIIFHHEALGYQSLEQQSDQLAAYLVKKGIQPEELVPVCMERGFKLVISILGILKSGAAFVPIDPVYPDERIAYMLDNVNARLMLGSDTLMSRLSLPKGVTFISLDKEWDNIMDSPSNAAAVRVAASQLAYVVYTSGSTGRPKGVMIRHSSIFNFIEGTAGIVDVRNSRIYSLATISFDIFLQDLFLALYAGGTLVLASEEEQEDAEKATAAMISYQADMLQCTPSRMRLLLDGGDQRFLQHLKVIMLGGEAFTPELFKEITNLYRGKLYNAYGPTETTVYTSFKEMCDINDISVGTPLANTAIYVLDQELQLQGTGIYGEICIAGSGLAIGYLGQPELTAEKFIYSTAVPGQLLYRTGDLGRWLGNGELSVAGRNDDQIKVRGFRIEPGEIETVLQQTGMVKRAVVIARKDHMGSGQLIGYIVPAADYQKEVMVTRLKAVLPAYMVPAIWIRMEELPITTNGKIDKSKLPGYELQLEEKVYIPPDSAVEVLVSDIWQDILGKERISTDEDFFAAGGHSLFAVRVISALKKKLKIELPVRLLFELPTIRLLSQSVDILLMDKVEDSDEYTTIRL